MAEDPSHLYKIILVGDAAVGKTYLLNKYVRNTTPKNPASTIGVEFATRTVELKVGGKVKAQIWDTAGQERYRSITSAHYRRALGALLVYDITRENTFDNLKKWMEEVKNLCETDITMMLVGNKSDLSDKRKVWKEDAKKFADEYGLLFVETSAYSGNNVNDCFEELLERIFEKKERQKAIGNKPDKQFNSNNNQINFQPQPQTKPNSCC